MLTANKLITLLQQLDPTIPIVIRLQGYAANQVSCPDKQNLHFRPALETPQVDRIALEAADIINTWDGDTCTVAAEITVRVVARTDCNTSPSRLDLRLLTISDIASACHGRSPNAISSLKHSGRLSA